MDTTPPDGNEQPPVEDPADLQRGLLGLVGRSRTLALHELETKDAAEVYDEAVAPVCSLLEQAIELFTRTLSRYEDPDPAASSSTKEADGEASFFEKVDSMMTQEPGARVADLAFMGRWELESRLGRVRRLRKDTPSWNILAVCSSALRRVVKAATALEGSLRDKEGLPGGVDQGFVTELMLSLKVRRAYASFWRAVVSEDPPSTDEVHRRLRLGAIQIAKLIGRSVYPDLRILDRMEIRKLQSNILDWLRSSERDPRAGLRIWHDLNAFAGLLVLVNRRTELKEHDEVQLRELEAFLQRPRAEVEDGWAVALETAAWLRGRDAELDTIVEAADIGQLARLRDVVRKVLATLGEDASATPRPVPKDISDIIILLQERGD